MQLLASLLISVSSSAFAEGPAAPLEDVLGTLSADRLFRDADVAVQVVDLASGEEVWSVDPDEGLNPASTMKVITAATALKTLGPSYAYRTTVLGDKEPDGSGTVKGSIYVRGSGDPTMVAEKLWKLARDLKLAGVSKVNGDLVLDESFFGADHKLVGWDKPADIERGPSYFPALSALSLNFNNATLVLRPGSESGKPAVVKLETSADGYIAVDATKMKTGRKGSRPTVDLERVVERGRMKFVLEGSVPVDDRVRRYHRSVANPTKYFGAAFAEILEDRGIKVTGKVRTGVTPEKAKPLASLVSPPLTTVLMDMNKYSSNFMAEQVLRTVGAETKGSGTTASGIAAAHEYLDGLGLERDTYTLVNGSGLTRSAKVPPSVLTAVLVDMGKDPRVGHEFTSSLAIAGRDGTLRRRLTSDPGRLRGKTGTLDGVHCLAGFVESEDGGIYAFAFLANGYTGGSARVKELHDEFAQRMFDVSSDATADDARAGKPNP